MRQVNVYGPNDVRLDPAEPQVIGRNDVAIRICACGICGTDLGYVRGGGRRRDGSCPLPLGHEAAGVVTEVGRDVMGVREGLRVIVNPMGSMDNIIGCGGDQGAFTERLVLRDVELNRSLFEIPASVPFDIASLAEPLGVAMHAVNRAQPRRGETAVVCGAGPIGLGAVIWLKRRGVSNIVVIDLAEARLVIARTLGATRTVLVGRDSLEEALHTEHGTVKTLYRPAPGTDIFIDAAGVRSFVEEFVRLGRTHARLVSVGVHREPVQLDLGAMLTTELSITTSMGYPTELPDVLAAMDDMGAPMLAPLITHRFAFESVLQAFDEAAKQTGAKVVVEFDA
jgi:(R,R)-butanediol dehydrogenase / meso-butanediol dehydrogenase / diacetyl reductase